MHHYDPLPPPQPLVARFDASNQRKDEDAYWSSTWHSEYNLAALGGSKRSLLVAYFLAMATMFEPEKSKERLAWAKTAIFSEAIDSTFGKEKASWEERNDFVNEFKTLYMSQDYVGNERITQPNTKKAQRLLGPFLSTLNQLALDALAAYGQDTQHQLYQAWDKWLRTWKYEGDRHKGEAELLVHVIELCSGCCFSEDVLSHPHTLCLLDLTNQVCHQLRHLHSHNHNNTKVRLPRPLAFTYV
ncbi:hypothetical protein Cgig2_016062 [Carnegiea gigantea]|uniref:Terpene synthase metal-binding domain-containing protein n=1 Tax=Carnegiea gigantea TaxID=171969 RepID=A0A9Q1Q828_9CARY|nr:hypothetical protein Cgig2_016062 [Carnegiea gigantea]